MVSVGKENSLRGKWVEKTIADRYDGTLISNDHSGCDIELKKLLLEVKSSLSWHSYNRGKYHYPGRFLINVEYHEEFKKKAEEKCKEAIYDFVKISRHDDGTIEEDTEEFQEAWMRWEHVDKLIKDSNKVGIVKSRLMDGFVRYYYAVKLGYVFGNNKSTPKL